MNESLRLARVWLRAVCSTRLSKGTTLKYDTSTTTTPNRSHAERERALLSLFGISSRLVTSLARYCPAERSVVDVGISFCLFNFVD